MAIVYIGSSSSECGSCGKNALPSQPAHISSPTYGDLDRKGCGERWTGVSSNYAGMTKYMVDPNVGFTYKNLVGLPVFDLGKIIGVYGGSNGDSAIQPR